MRIFADRYKEYMGNHALIHVCLLDVSTDFRSLVIHQIKFLLQSIF